ncbi:MAG: hypothetical protein P4L49_11415 [Desulfosporosinus sp.]|nr:hypothetical protein [Desulfosporosinus sp.]
MASEFVQKEQPLKAVGVSKLIKLNNILLREYIFCYNVDNRSLKRKKRISGQLRMRGAAMT